MFHIYILLYLKKLSGNMIKLHNGNGPKCLSFICSFELIHLYTMFLATRVPFSLTHYTSPAAQITVAGGTSGGIANGFSLDYTQLPC